MGGDEIIVPDCGDAVVPGEDRKDDNCHADPVQSTAQRDATDHLPCRAVTPHCISLFPAAISRASAPS
jgi:hypothetical protein